MAAVASKLPWISQLAFADGVVDRGRAVENRGCYGYISARLRQSVPVYQHLWPPLKDNPGRGTRSPPGGKISYVISYTVQAGGGILPITNGSSCGLSTPRKTTCLMPWPV